MRRTLALTALSAVAVLAAGCGVSEEERFRKEELRPASQRIEQRKSILSARLQTVRLGRQRDARAVRADVDGLAVEVRRLGELDPPDSADDEFKRFAAANRGLVRALRRFADDLAGRSERKLEIAGQSATEAAGRVARARNALDDALAK